MRIDEKTSEIVKVIKLVNNHIGGNGDIVGVRDMDNYTIIVVRMLDSFTVRIYVDENNLTLVCEPLNKLSAFDTDDKATILETALRLSSLNFNRFMGRYRINEDSDEVSYTLTIPDSAYIKYECVDKVELLTKLTKSFWESIGVAVIYLECKKTGKSITNLINEKFKD